MHHFRCHALNPEVIARYAPELNEKRTKVFTKNSRGQNEFTSLPINGPSVIGQKLLAGCLQRIVGTQVLDSHGDSSQRINTGFLHILDNTNSIEAGSRGGDDRVMHDLECNTINQVVRNNLNESVYIVP